MAMSTRSGFAMTVLTLFALCAAARSEPLAGTELANALQRGGYVILMRHASSPGTPPDPTHAEPDNLKHERQLDETGRNSARSMGEAFRRLRIPVGQVLSSPTYRARETAQLARFGSPQTFAELGDAGKSMSPDASGKRGAWLRARVVVPPHPHTNTVIITHYPNIAEAFPADAKDLADGEALVFRPDGHGGAALIARVKIEQWPGLAMKP